MVLNLYDNLGISSVDSYLNIRSEPREDGDIIGKMTSKSAGEILETSEDGKWYKIKSGPVTGYVSADYILTGQAAKDEALQVAELMAIVSTDRLNAREQPTQDSKIWTQISNNERYPVTEQLDGWVGIELDTSTAYVSTDYVDVRYALPEAVKFSPLDGNQSLRNKMVNYGLQFVGNRYVWGGNDPHTGADCSGFVQICLQPCGRNYPAQNLQRAGQTGNSDQIFPDAAGRSDFLCKRRRHSQPCGHVHWKRTDCPCGQPQKRNQDFHLELQNAVPHCKYAGRLRRRSERTACS